MENKKVMIVDDDREFLEELQETLTLSGYDIAIFDNGESALSKGAEVRPDVILLDLKMSGRSGFEIADMLKHNPKTMNIPIIAMTAFYSGEEHRQLMNLCGIKSCLIKPFNPVELIAKIEME